MASPFYLFRKYQKAFLVVAGVLAMFIFVVADPLMSWLQSSGGGGGQRNARTVVATWDGGSLNLQQLDMLSQRRFKISEFLRNLVGVAAGIVEKEGGTALTPTLPDFRLQDNDPRSVQVGCVTTRILAEQAKKSGISISDDVINHYLREWGLRRMGDVEMANILGRIGLNDKMLFAGLRELLMGNFYMTSYSLATRGIMPEERWQDWKRINERISVETAILPAEKFLADLPEPSEAELKAFYELHKDRIEGSLHLVMNTRLPSPDPGFREPRRVKIQYLLGNVNDWTQKMSDTVTEAEISDYYERNKRIQFVQTSTSTSAAGLFDDAEAEAETPADKGEAAVETSDEASDEAPMKEEPSEEAPAEETSTDDSEQPAETETKPDAESDAESTEETPSDKGEEAVESSDETPAEESPADTEEQPKEEPVDQPAEEESSQSTRTSPFRLVAFQEDAEAVEGETASEVATDSETENPEVEAEVEAEASSPETEPEAEEPTQYVPLEEVSEQIRRTLAQDKAVVELQKVVDRTYANLQSSYNPYGFKVVSARTEEQEVPTPPAELSDYKSLATETGLASEETVLLSGKDLAETFVGKAFDAQSRREFVVSAMFGDQELFEPYRAIDLDGNWYIVCKTEDVASSVPEFDAVRDAVLAAWKKQEAAKLALAKAQELAKQAETSGDTVATVAGAQSYEVVTTDMFSWLTFGTTQAEMQRGPRLGEAPPLQGVDAEFMTEAFKLQPDQRIALLNHDHSSAYVVQLDRREQAEAEMRQQFLAEANTWYGGRVMNSVRGGAAQRRLLAQLAEQMGLNLDKLEEMLAKESQ